MGSPNAQLAPFSALMGVYAGDDARYVDSAIESVFDQSVVPAEVVLVEDGPLSPALSGVVRKWSGGYPSVFQIVRLPANVGCGKAFSVGVERCSYDTVARMDADDINLPDRFAEQVLFLEDHRDIALVNSWMAVFHEDPARTEYIRKVPTAHEDIVRMAKVRSPVNHPTVVFRRSAVLAAGNYPDRRKSEDYPLWVSMLQVGCRMACLPKTLVKHRCSRNLAMRRHDFTAYKYQMLTQSELLAAEFITVPRYVANIAVRTAAYSLPTPLMRLARTALRM